MFPRPHACGGEGKGEGAENANIHLEVQTRRFLASRTSTFSFDLIHPLTPALSPASLGRGRFVW